VDSLIVIGGDGSLTGADVFRREWPELLQAAEAAGVAARGRSAFLRIVGLVGSIDNDMCGTDYTIGSDSALHRITEAVDAILSTAASHRRSFVVEVMGRNCGYLALMSALISGADYVFLPEAPPTPGWEEHLCSVLGEGRKLGKRCSLVIVAEGAIDTAGQPIHAETIKKLLEQRLGHDTRITALGHVQRGGTPSAFDRNMSSLLGVAAVDTVFRIGNESVMIGWSGNRVTTSPLMECVAVVRDWRFHVNDTH
jgi:6-phosphofructokinase 1